jgi:hypothetical protein
VTTADLARTLIDIEQRRLRALVDARAADADALHASDFEFVSPSGGVWSRERYLGGVADGSINYRRFEPVSDIEVMADEDLAVLRYRAIIDISIRGNEGGVLDCWHLDCYRRDGDGHWQVRWSQATSIDSQ